MVNAKILNYACIIVSIAMMLCVGIADFVTVGDEQYMNIPAED